MPRVESKGEVRPGAGEISTLLRAWTEGDALALEKLTPLVYNELHAMAGRYLRRERAGHSLQASALVNEAYLKLVDCDGVEWQNRTHFFAISANLMRRILVEHARRRNVKRGGDALHIPLDDAPMVGGGQDRELVALDDALRELARLDERKVRVVEMRYFGGLSVEETAILLEVSAVTVMRDWRSAKAWLYGQLRGGAGDGLRTLEASR